MAVQVSSKKNKDFEEELLFLTEDEISGLLTFLTGDTALSGFYLLLFRYLYGATPIRNIRLEMERMGKNTRIPTAMYSHGKTDIPMIQIIFLLHYKKATAAFGRPEITLHKLRHTYTSLLINKGWDAKNYNTGSDTPIYSPH